MSSITSKKQQNKNGVIIIGNTYLGLVCCPPSRTVVETGSIIYCILFSGQFCKQTVQANQHVLLLSEFRHASYFCDLCFVLLCHWTDEHNHWLMLSGLFEIYKVTHVRSHVLVIYDITSNYRTRVRSLAMLVTH